MLVSYYLMLFRSFGRKGLHLKLLKFQRESFLKLFYVLQENREQVSLRAPESRFNSLGLPNYLNLLFCTIILFKI